MRVRVVTFWIVAVIVVTAACSDRAPLSPSAVPSAAPATTAISTERAPVPMVGTLEGQTYFDAAIPCPGPPAHFATVSLGSGNVSHLGLANLQSQHCIVSFNPDGSLLISGTVVIRAPNGDEIHADYSGSMYGYSPAPEPGALISASGPMVVTGGTGRFEDASGQGEFAVEVTAAATSPWPALLTFKASIVY